VGEVVAAALRDAGRGCGLRRLVRDEQGTLDQAPVVRHPDIGLDDAQRVARGLLQARGGFVHFVRCTAVHVHLGCAEDEQTADCHGDQQLDQAQAARACALLQITTLISHGAHICMFSV
jgi:hypothetical protein